MSQENFVPTVLGLPLYDPTFLPNGKRVAAMIGAALVAGVGISAMGSAVNDIAREGILGGDGRTFFKMALSYSLSRITLRLMTYNLNEMRKDVQEYFEQGSPEIE